MNTYWNENGKHQEQIDELQSLIPSWGMTENSYMNLLITASKVYYDVHNNGGCNLLDVYMDDINAYIKPFAKEFTKLRFDVLPATLYRNLKNVDKLESFMDDLVVYLSDKDLSYKKYTLYYSSENELLSVTEKEGFRAITFGLEEEYKSWKNSRLTRFGYQMV